MNKMYIINNKVASQYYFHKVFEFGMIGYSNTNCNAHDYKIVS